MLPIIPHFISGQRVTAGQQALPVYNPALGAPIRQIHTADSDTILQAIASAREAFKTWSKTPPIKRARLLFDYRALIQQHENELIELISTEHGKTREDARGSLIRGLEVIEFACGIPSLLKGDFSENVGAAIDCHSIRQPLGVCAGITPFNFPAMVPMWMFPLAIACGNTFILKPSEKNPSCPLRLVELLHEAGLPPGVVNVLQGDKTVVQALLTHPDIAAISSVGSTPVAEYIYQTGCAHGKRVQALGGAKNHCIVMPDADIEQTANALLGAGFGSAGERCMAISAVLAVGDAVADALVERLTPMVKQLKIGAWDDPTAEMGPLISKAHWQTVRQYVDAGVEAGAQLVVDGRGFQHPEHPQGYFLGGCLFDHVTADMRIYQEEIFGPVLVILRVADYAEALALVNAHPYGNGTAIFTRDGDVARSYAAEVQVGMVGINVPIPVPVAYHSFGGWKRSLFGDMHTHGAEGIRFYTRLKAVTSRWPSGLKENPQFTIPTLGQQ